MFICRLTSSQQQHAILHQIKSMIEYHAVLDLQVVMDAHMVFWHPVHAWPTDGVSLLVNVPTLSLPWTRTCMWFCIHVQNVQESVSAAPSFQQLCSPHKLPCLKPMIPSSRALRSDAAQPSPNFTQSRRVLSCSPAGEPTATPYGPSQNTSTSRGYNKVVARTPRNATHLAPHPSTILAEQSPISGVNIIIKGRAKRKSGASRKQHKGRSDSKSKEGAGGHSYRIPLSTRW